MLDQTSLAAYFGNDSAMLRKFIGLFVAEAPVLVNQIDEAILESDWPAVEQHAHTLKSQLRYFGFSEQVSKLQEIENVAERRTDLEKLPKIWAELNPELGWAYKIIADLKV